MDLVRLVDEKILSVVEKVFKVFGEELDYQSFEAGLKKELDSLGCDILKILLEELDQQLRKDKERKKHWSVVRRNDCKTVTTLFGQLEYERRYYRHKDSKEYCYLVDEKAGFGPHARIGENLKAELIDASAAISYEGATAEISRYNQELKISKQTVATCVKAFQLRKDFAPLEKRKVETLYIEADEDHVKVKGSKKKTVTRLAYIHEGIEENPRRHLTNPKFFTTVEKSSEKFWYEIGEYLEANYDVDNIKAIYLSGDGGKWIKGGLDYIDGAIFVLDKFHLYKRITAVTGHAKELRMPLYRGIWATDQEAVLKHLREARNRAQTNKHKKRIDDTARYIQNNWDGIVAQVNHPHVGCSAEGHVSHILAARMSSRPMAWSSTGAEHMAQMRATRANGESVKEHYLSGQKTAPKIIELKEVMQKQLKCLEHRKQVGREYIINMPLLNGASTYTTMALKGLNARMII